MKTKINILAYVIFSFLGLAFTLQSSLKIEIAKGFLVDTSRIQIIFTILTIGSTVAVMLNKHLLEKLSFKSELIIGSLLLIISFWGMAGAKTIKVFTYFMPFYGLGLGLFVSLSNYMIITSYGKESSQKLNFLNFCYSFGSLLCPMLIVYLFTLKFNWRNIYFFSGILILFFLLFLFFCKFEKKKQEEEKISCKKKINKKLFLVIFTFLRIIFSSIKKRKLGGERIAGDKSKKIGKNGNFIGIAMFSYVCSEMIFNFWIIEFLENKGVSSELAKLSLTIFWIFIAIGRFLSILILKKLKTEWYIIRLSIFAIFSFFPLYFSNNIIIVFVFIAFSGFAYSGLYASILSYGIKQSRSINSGIITFYILCGSFGGLFASPFSSYLKRALGVDLTLFSSLGFMMILLITITLTLKKEKNMV